jgi:hypothetical protein
MRYNPSGRFVSSFSPRDPQRVGRRYNGNERPTLARAIEDVQRERIAADRIREVELATFAAIDADDTRAKDADRALFESVVNASQQLRVHGLILSGSVAEALFRRDEVRV